MVTRQHLGKRGCMAYEGGGLLVPGNHSLTAEDWESLAENLEEPTVQDQDFQKKGKAWRTGWGSPGRRKKAGGFV